MHYLFPPFFYSNSSFSFLPNLFGWLLFPLLAWHIVWKGFALWHAARNHQKGWFIALLIINTVGVLDILYLLFFQKPCCKNCCCSGSEPKAKTKPRKRSQSK